MTSMLPPTRDLPPGRQARIRAELESEVAGRRSLRFVVPVLAGVAAVAAVVTSVVMLRPAPAPGPTPAVHITSAPPTSGFGVPPEAVAAFEEGCAQSAGVGKAKMRQLLNEETDWALLYTEREALTCSLGVGGHKYNAGFGQAAIKWLPGHFSIDYSGASAGGAADGQPDVPGFRTVVGRVSERVAKVTVTADDRTVEAKVANGTYAARMYYPSSWVIQSSDMRPTIVRAYDAAGTLLGDNAGPIEVCYYDPQSLEVVYGTRTRPYKECQAATPWR
ncbi:hypothetical protein ACIA8G_30050 [Lentzea sp. NPDC051213]|uniref:hypothetical protein n=1 Tax=Lentzea sp. NPDC051213 TaxID=3364126 RepID=UPI0037A8E346